MNQDQWILLCFKAVEIASVLTIGAFIACYSRWAKWRSNAIGRTIVYKDIAIILTLIPPILSVFFRFNRLTSRVGGWFDIASFALVPIIMCWRIAVFWRIHRDGAGAATESSPETEE